MNVERATGTSTSQAWTPPTSGKSTTTQALHRLDPRFRLLRKLKVGTGRAEEYHLVTAARLDELRQAGRTVAETHRYGNTYAIDRAEVDDMGQAGLIPVAHIGNIADLRRLVGRDPWLRVLLWVPREVCEQRSRHRGDVDTAQRLAAWEADQPKLCADWPSCRPARLPLMPNCGWCVAALLRPPCHFD
ncbi:hypothetical protein OG589_37545 [Sphaerisporangium sp. NBC_01403]|uniref:hypothetical protein n=1 Tax=Sphaerisporangium sp. NBC_01403 TaxID=2903599 RepID=UPI003247ACFD